jgi:23S rRNA pseudouridine1911/1915/1917 synthase
MNHHAISNIKVESSVSERLDKYLPSVFHDYSRTFFQNLIKNGKVKLNGIAVSAKTQVSNGADIEIVWPEEKVFTIPSPEEFKFDILFEDDDLLVIDKPAGIVVHPAAGNWTGTVVNALVGRDTSFLGSVLEDEPDELSSARPGIVHRLDKENKENL